MKIGSIERPYRERCFEEIVGKINIPPHTNLLRPSLRRSERRNAYSLFEHLDADGDRRICSWELARFFPSVSVLAKLTHREK